MRRTPQCQSQLQIDHPEDASTPSDRVAATKPEEDRRRRTIIVEKRGGSYGFTLQSYGIHYKREQEIEMITYVDFVDYDGPAYRAGMREGDVILAINGADMEKADHKTLVGFIKNCDARMRMVVLFEDCVRKVELHMRYIQLQRVLQTKMAELERLCVKERQLLEGKWKTHSLPARKKASQSNASGADPGTPTQPGRPYCRPTVSTEDVARAQSRRSPPPPALILAYQYLDPHYRYALQPGPGNGSGEYLLAFEPPKHHAEKMHFIVKTPCEPPQSSANRSNKGNQTSTSKSKKSQGAHLCNPCIQRANNADNTSLDAYDLASPCCDPHCVPTAKRRSRNHRKRDSKTEETQTEPQQQQQQQQRQQHCQTQTGQNSNSGPARRYLQLGAGLVSQCSLHSCTSSDVSSSGNNVQRDAVRDRDRDRDRDRERERESSASYTTSLSTDTLYWDGSCDLRSLKQPQPEPQYVPIMHETTTTTTTYIQYSNKPKSWDNLATKAFGGYGFGYGYGYLECASPVPKCTGKTHSRSHSTKTGHSSTLKSGNAVSVYTPHTQRRYMQGTKSSESLLSLPKYAPEPLSDSSCECLDGSEAKDGRFYQSPRQSVASPTDPNFGYYSSVRKGKDAARNPVTTSSEATRL